MLSARRIFQEIRANDEAYRFFCSLAAKGEGQGGWENERIAELTRDEELRAKIQRHGEDEKKHGRLFLALLKKRSLDPVEVAPEADYCGLLESAGIGIRHARLREDRPLSDEELLEYLVHSRVTEQRGCEEIQQQREVFGDDPELGRAIRMIAEDEVDHFDYTNEELLRYVERGYGDTIRRMLVKYALAEIAIYRRMSLAVLRRMAGILAWSAPKRAALSLGIHAIYLLERAWRWRRLTVLRPPERRNALGSR